MRLMPNANCQFDRKNWSIIKRNNSLSYIKIGIEILTFDDIEIEKNKFTAKSLIFKKDVYNEKSLYI